MVKYLDKYNFPKLNKEEAESLNRLITADKIEALMKKLPAHKGPAVDGFTEHFYKEFKDALTPILHRLFEKVREERRFQNYFCEASNTLIPNPDKDTTKKENIRPISLMNIDVKILKNISKSHPAIH